MSEQKLNIDELKKGGIGTPPGKRYVLHLGQDGFAAIEFKQLRQNWRISPINMPAVICSLHRGRFQ